MLCPEFLRCDGKNSHIAFCRNPQWNEDGIDKIVPQNAIYRLPQPSIEFKAHLVAVKGLYISSTGHLFDRNTRYYRGGKLCLSIPPSLVPFTNHHVVC